MLGSMSKDKFKPDENYEEFYAHHTFQPLDEHTALNVDLVLPRAAWAIDVARETGAKTLLDLCCLDGFVALTLASKLTMEVVGVDLSKDGIDLANERAQKHNLAATFIQSPVEELNLGKQFDLITLFEAIEHFTDVDAVMQVIKKHLKPGGTLLVSTPDAEGKYGIENVEDVCHLQIYTHRATGELADETAEGKPIIPLAEYLEAEGFTTQENEVYNELVHVRATL